MKVCNTTKKNWQIMTVRAVGKPSVVCSSRWCCDCRAVFGGKNVPDTLTNGCLLFGGISLANACLVLVLNTNDVFGNLWLSITITCRRPYGWLDSCWYIYWWRIPTVSTVGYWFSKICLLRLAVSKCLFIIYKTDLKLPKRQKTSSIY